MTMLAVVTKSSVYKFGIIFVLWILAILLDLQFSFGFAGFFDIILLLGFASVLLILVGFFQYASRRKTRVVAIGAILFAFCLSEMFVSGTIVLWQKNSTIKEADAIIKALDSYYHKSKKYPESLNELVPGYLKKVPTTKMGWFGTDFFYDSSKVKVKYSLGFNYHVFIICSYSPLQKGWVCDD